MPKRLITPRPDLKNFLRGFSIIFGVAARSRDPTGAEQPYSAICAVLLSARDHPHRPLSLGRPQREACHRLPRAGVAMVTWDGDRSLARRGSARASTPSRCRQGPICGRVPVPANAANKSWFIVCANPNSCNPRPVCEPLPADQRQSGSHPSHAQNRRSPHRQRPP